MSEKNDFQETEFRRGRKTDPDFGKKIAAEVLALLIIISAVLLWLYLTRWRPDPNAPVPSGKTETSAPAGTSGESEEPSAEPSASEEPSAQTEEPSAQTEEPSAETPAPTEPPTSPPETESTTAGPTAHQEVITPPVLTGETLEEEGVVFDLTEPQEVTAKGHVNLRTYPGVRDDADIVGTLYHGDWATRVGIGRNGWARLEWNGQIVYCVGSYITTDPDYAIE